MSAVFSVAGVGGSHDMVPVLVTPKVDTSKKILKSAQDKFTEIPLIFRFASTNSVQICTQLI